MAALEDRYRQSQRALQARIRRALTRTYGETIEPDELDASFIRLFPKVAQIVRAGQAAGVTITTAYLSALVLRDARRTARLPILRELVGTTKAGTFEQAMGAWPVMVKHQIAEGRSTEEAVEYGSYLVTRFGDAEVTRVMDEQMEHATTKSGAFRGWVGILHPPTCDECVARNMGFHGLDEQPFRHGSCDCSVQYVAA